MQSKAIILLLVIASVLVMSQLAAGQTSENSPQCRSALNCSNRCCINNKCADDEKWCPCSSIRNPCNRISQICVPQQVQCVVAPCYPIANCLPRWLPVQPNTQN